MLFKEEFVIFLAQSGALRFGDFTLKSGRKSPYFITTGSFHSGRNIARLGEFYAEAISHYWDNVNLIYGPAYKGIPLCVATAIAMQAKGINVDYVFNRKEKKRYGQKETLVGAAVDETSKIVLVDDVITSGLAIREALTYLPDTVTIQGVLVCVDRKECGIETGQSALTEVQNKLSIPVRSIVDIDDVINALYKRSLDGVVYIDDKVKQDMERYREVHTI